MKAKSTRIAVLLTCHNRKKLTERCVKSVEIAVRAINDKHINLHYFITDDSCTDGTPDMIASNLPPERLTIIEADGNAFWAGGMRMAWRAALKHSDWDFFLLLNDDTIVFDNLFSELFEAHEYSLETFHKSGIYSGNTCEVGDHNKITFGGKVKKGHFLYRFERLMPNGTPQRCDIVNANILMVSNDVVGQIGIFPDCYIHGCADNDYGYRCNDNDIPVLITSNVCGACDADNYNFTEELSKLRKMSLSGRYKYLRFPVHSIHDLLQLYFRWRKMFVLPIIARQLIILLMPGLLLKIIKRQ